MSKSVDSTSHTDTLLRHPAKLEGERVRLNDPSPEESNRFATMLMQAFGVSPNKSGLAAAMRDDYPNQLAHHAAWLHQLSAKALYEIQQAQPAAKKLIREIWAIGFHAGARHETITVDSRYLKYVRTQEKIRAGAKLGGAARRKLTLPQIQSGARKEPSEFEAVRVG